MEESENLTIIIVDDMILPVTTEKGRVPLWFGILLLSAAGGIILFLS